MGFGPQIAFGGSDDGGGGGGGDGGRERGRTPDPVAVATPDPEPVVEESSWSNSVFNPSNWFSGDDDDPAPAPAPDPEPDPDPTPNSSMSMADQYASYGAGKIAPTPTPETNAERVVRETTEKLVETGQISPEQTTPAMTQGAVDLLNATGVPSSDTNPLLTDTMGIGSDGRLLDAVTGATDAGVIIDTIGTPTVEAKSPTLAQTFKDEDDTSDISPASTKTDATIGSLLDDAGNKLEDISKTVSDAVTPYLPQFLQDFRQPYVDEANTRIATRDLPPVTDKTFIGPKLPGTTIDTVGKDLPQIERDFLEQATATAGNQLYSLLGGATRGLAETFGGDDSGTPSFLSQVGANTAAEGRARTQALLEDDTTGLGERYTGGVTKVTGDNVGGIFNPLNYSRPIDPETGQKISFEDSAKNLLTKGLVTGIQAVPILASLPFSTSAAVLTGMSYGVGEVVNDADAELAAQRAAGALTNADGTPISDAQYESLRRDVAQNATALGSVTGAIETTLLPGFGKGIISRALTGGGSGMLTEAAQIESANLASSSAMTPGAAAYEAGRTQNADELLTAALVGGTAPIFTPPMSTTRNVGTDTTGGIGSLPVDGSGGGAGGTGLTVSQRNALSGIGTEVNTADQTGVTPFISEGVALDPQSTIDTVGRGPTTQKQDGTVEDAIFTDIPVNPNVQTTAPAQIAPPEVTTSAPNIITGQTTSTTRGAPPDLSQPTTGSLPAFDISSVGQPQVQSTAPQSITIPGTNVTVDVPALTTQQSRPDVPAIPTGLASLGTGGVFTPNLAPGSTVSAAQPAVDTTSQTQSVNETIAQEVAREGGLSIETAQRLARENNLSVQEVANLAENAMGVDTSTATGPSTALTTPTETGVASTDTTQAGVEPFVSEGVVLDPEGAVVTTEPLPAIDDTIEGTFTEPNTEVDISRRRANVPVAVDPKKAVVAPTDTTTVVTDVVPQTQLVPSPYDPLDDGGVTVEVDEEEDVPADGEDVVVEFGSTFDDDDSDDDVAVEEDAPFECPDGFEAVKVDGGWRCQMTGEAPEKVRPTAGAYYRPTQNPNYGAAARRRRA